MSYVVPGPTSPWRIFTPLTNHAIHSGMPLESSCIRIGFHLFDLNVPAAARKKSRCVYDKFEGHTRPLAAESGPTHAFKDLMALPDHL